MASRRKCVCCGTYGTNSFNPLDREHTKTRGSGGSNQSENVSDMCRIHHTEKGQKGVTYMADKYPNYKKWLLENGWHFDEYRRKWVNHDANKFIVKGEVRN